MAGIKAITITSNVTPHRVGYIAPGKIQIDMATDNGEVVTYNVTTSGLFELIRLSTSMLNSFNAQVLRDLERAG